MRPGWYVRRIRPIARMRNEARRSIRCRSSRCRTAAVASLASVRTIVGPDPDGAAQYAARSLRVGDDTSGRAPRRPTGPRAGRRCASRWPCAPVWPRCVMRSGRRRIHGLERELLVPHVAHLRTSRAGPPPSRVSATCGGFRRADTLPAHAREHSSGNRRPAISKQGDRYLRTLLMHGARRAPTAATRRRPATWAPRLPRAAGRTLPPPHIPAGPLA